MSRFKTSLPTKLAGAAAAGVSVVPPELESYLDQARGDCHLRRPEVAKLVEDALLFFNNVRYELRAWIVMPNHVHVLFKVGKIPMSEILATWKKHTAYKANQFLDKRGEFWQADYWDTFMRDAEHELETGNYIENNPAKAKLVLDSKTWAWSSARFRDEYGNLKL